MRATDGQTWRSSNHYALRQTLDMLEPAEAVAVAVPALRGAPSDTRMSPTPLERTLARVQVHKRYALEVP